MKDSPDIFATRSQLENAHHRTNAWIHRTPVLTSAYFDKQTGARLYFKCENFQKTGAFKIRGVLRQLGPSGI
jgi:threonine dehydratase